MLNVCVCCPVISDVIWSMCVCVIPLSQMLYVKCLCVLSRYLRCYMLNVCVCCPVISDDYIIIFLIFIMKQLAMTSQTQKP